MFASKELIETATAATGLTDFGKPDFEEALAVLVNAYNEEAGLSEIGQFAIRGELIGNLSARLQVIDALKKAPEAHAAKIERPIFILGFPRTGTTTLHNMIQANPDCQVLEHWLGVSPRHRPPRDQWESDPDYQRIAEILRQQYEANPDFRAQHDVSADGADECRLVFAQRFMDDTFGYLTNIPSYRHWLDQQSMVPAYQWHRDVLKVLQYPDDTQRRWVLKYPSHMAWLKDLLTVYPDACIIHTHRNPADTIPSFASLLSGVASLFSDSWQPQDIGPFLAEQWRRRVDDYLDFREQLNRENQFFDIQFADVLRDPVEAVSKAFAKFDMALSDHAKTAMGNWLESHPPGRHGKHRYTAEEFGLNRDELSESFKRYRERFGLYG